MESNVQNFLLRNLTSWTRKSKILLKWVYEYKHPRITFAIPVWYVHIQYWHSQNFTVDQQSYRDASARFWKFPDSASSNQSYFRLSRTWNSSQNVLHCVVTTCCVHALPLKSEMAFKTSNIEVLIATRMFCEFCSCRW